MECFDTRDPNLPTSSLHHAFPNSRPQSPCFSITRTLLIFFHNLNERSSPTTFPKHSTNGRENQAKDQQLHACYVNETSRVVASHRSLNLITRNFPADLHLSCLSLTVVHLHLVNSPTLVHLQVSSTTANNFGDRRQIRLSCGRKSWRKNL